MSIVLTLAVEHKHRVFHKRDTPYQAVPIAPPKLIPSQVPAGPLAVEVRPTWCWFKVQYSRAHLLLTYT
jgi:hypothetical protein